MDKIAIPGEEAVLLNLSEVSPGVGDTQRIRRKIIAALLQQNTVVLLNLTPRERGGRFYFPDTMSPEQQERFKQSIQRMATLQLPTIA